MTLGTRILENVLSRKNLSPIEETLALNLRAYKIEFEREYRFHNKRRWRFDFYIPSKNLLVECQGGVWINGGHNRGKGYTDNVEKMNEAVLMGYKVMWFTGDHVAAGTAIDMIRSVEDAN